MQWRAALAIFSIRWETCRSSIRVETGLERELTLVNRSPLVLRADRSRVQFNPSLDHIPGSAVRGALAAIYLQRYGDDEVFRDLFAGGAASFGDLYPSTNQAGGYPLPTTAMACKIFQIAHRPSLTDSLLRLACAAALDDPRPVRDGWHLCPEAGCESRRDRVGGYCTPSLEEIRVYRRVLAGTAIHRTTGTVETGRLYSQEALEEGQVFSGVIRVLPAAEALWPRFQETMTVGSRLVIGAAKSRGMGLVEIEAWREAPVNEPLDSRLNQFNGAWRALWRGVAGADPEEEVFSITFSSHLLLRDRVGLPVGSLAGREDVGMLFGLAGARLGRHALVPATAKGWDARKGLPKSDEIAIGRGSVLLFHARSSHLAALVPRLVGIEAEGLGRRKAEGFGRVRVCDPFHVRFLLGELEARQ
jgi:CRISPR-associated protein Csx10